MYQAVPAVCVLYETARSQNKNALSAIKTASFKNVPLGYHQHSKTLPSVIEGYTNWSCSNYTFYMDSGWQDLFHPMTQCPRLSDLILVSSAIKTCKVLVDTACLHLSSSESEALFFPFFPPQINSSAQCWGIKQAWISLRCESEEVLRLRNTVIRPPLELSKDLEAPRQREKHEEISLGTILFPHGCPVTMSSLRNPSSQV